MLNACALKRNPITRFSHVSFDTYKGFYFISERVCVYPTTYDIDDTKFYRVLYAMALKIETFLTKHKKFRKYTQMKFQDTYKEIVSRTITLNITDLKNYLKSRTPDLSEGFEIEPGSIQASPKEDEISFKLVKTLKNPETPV